MSNIKILIKLLGPEEKHPQSGLAHYNDPLLNISSGRFGNVQLNRPPRLMHCSTIRYNAQNDTAHISNTDAMLPHEESGTDYAHLQLSHSEFLNNQAKSKGLPSFRFFTLKVCIILFFFFFLLMGLFAYGAMFNESSNLIYVLKSQAHKVSNFFVYQNFSLSVEPRLAVIKELGLLAQEAVENKLDDIVKKVHAAHLKYQTNFKQVPMLNKNEENGRFCLTKRKSSNFCNVTEEEKKHMKIFNATEKESELNYSAVLPSTINYCDHEFISSQSFEKLFLITMEKMLKNATENYSSHFFHEWLQLILANTKEDITQRLKLEFQKLKNNAPSITLPRKILENIVNDYTKYEAKSKTTDDKPIIYVEEGIASVFRELFNVMMLHYDADKEKFVDFASKAAGGEVLSVKQTENYFEELASFSFWKRWMKPKIQPNSPEAAIQPGMVPGECWAFKGSQGTLVIKLASKISPTGFTMEHIPVSQSPSGIIDSAPNEFSVWGLSSRNDNEGKTLGIYSYNLKGYSLQYFPVQYGFNQTFRIVELRIISNHGNSEYTCLYRFRVHGRTDKKTFDKRVVF